MKFAFLIMGDFHYADDRASIRDGAAQIVGVANLEEAAAAARTLCAGGGGQSRRRPGTGYRWDILPTCRSRTPSTAPFLPSSRISGKVKIKRLRRKSRPFSKQLTKNIPLSCTDSGMFFVSIHFLSGVSFTVSL